MSVTFNLVDIEVESFFPGERLVNAEFSLSTELALISHRIIDLYAGLGNICRFDSASRVF